MRKLTILSLSLLTLMAGATMSPLLTLIAKSYPATESVFIKSLVTIPSLMVIPISLIITKFLNQKFSKKHLVILGLLLYSVGGLIPLLFSLPFAFFMMCRVILGAGLGIIAPLAISLISDFYSGNEQQKMLGLASAMNNLGTVIAVLFAGIIGATNWKNGLLIYLLAVISLFLIMIYLPNQTEKNIKVELNSDGTKEKNSLIDKLLITFLQMFLATVVYFVIPTNLSFHLTTLTGHNSSAMTGMLMAWTSIVGIISGLLFKNVTSLFKTWTKSFVFLLFLCSMFIIAYSQNIFLLTLGLTFSGFALGIALPLFNQEIIAKSAARNRSIAISIGTSLIFLGQFVSPLLMDFIIKNLANKLTDSTFLIAAFLSLFLLFTAILNNFKTKK